MPALPYIAVAISVIGTSYAIYSGEQAKDKQKKLANEQAAFQQELGQRQADEIRRRAAAIKSGQTAQFAGAGAALDSEVVQKSLAETDTLAAKDIETTLSDSKRSAAYSLSVAKASGSSALNSQVGSGLSGLGSALNQVAKLNSTETKPVDTQIILDRETSSNNQYYLAMDTGSNNGYGIDPNKYASIWDK